ncbi:MAG: peptidylprolyl isomerase, partial [Acidimicrobiia bacterium]
NHYPLGSLAAAKGGSDAPGTFDSQFFVVTGSKGSTLPNDYARFGTVIKGLDVARKIEGLPIVGGAADGKPVTKITITSIRISKVDTSSLKTTTTTTTTTTTKP